MYPRLSSHGPSEVITIIPNQPASISLYHGHFMSPGVQIKALFNFLDVFILESFRSAQLNSRCKCSLFEPVWTQQSHSPKQPYQDLPEELVSVPEDCGVILWWDELDLTQVQWALATVLCLLCIMLNDAEWYAKKSPFSTLMWFVTNERTTVLVWLFVDRFWFV